LERYRIENDHRTQVEKHRADCITKQYYDCLRKANVDSQEFTNEIMKLRDCLKEEREMNREATKSFQSQLDLASKEVNKLELNQAKVTMIFA
jgi:soluble cytochrome b562